ncbi:MAG TPA: helix-turn-helix domain-containing protein [Solirubrobacterales bacterium]|jgi:transcriptional regulator GlxA family with amidase domain|nr:helix-turn-helix domain-containing protein [Solirubrobacterales bacterium]
MHRIVSLCLEGLVAFDLAAPAQAFTLAVRSDGEALYEFSACSIGGRELPTTTGFSVRPQGDLSALEAADTVVVPAYREVFAPPPAEAIAALQAAAERGARVLSVCTGAFALAHAGLLDGRRATTHWAFAPGLAEHFPAIEVDALALYVDEGQVMTSAGLSAGIDLCLHVIREDCGAAVGERAARHMVVAPHREGGQAQFIERPDVTSNGAAGSLEGTRRWVCERLEEPLEVAAMSRHANVSPRTFARRFREETGSTPLQWLLYQRVQEARRLLEETDLAIDAVAWRAGFGTAASLRDHFRRVTATTPTAYRRSFRPLAA